MTDPTILSAALFERDERVLTAHRKAGCPPFAGQWLLPMTPVRPTETAEDAVKRYTREQFGVQVAREAFVDTVYVEDPDDRRQYIANIFRADLAGGPMRFRADGDYDDARWLAASELDQLWMPPALREPLVRIMTDPAYAPDADWASKAPSDAAPLAERTEELPPAEEVPPADNRAGWNAIAKAYQEEIFGERFAGKLMWSWTRSEDDLRLLDDVRGSRVLVLGCGGGQDVVALSEMGAVATGIDQSEEQIAYARKFAAKRAADNASFVLGSVHDLKRFDDASFDAAVSSQMLNYVERIDDTLRATARVLRGGGVFALSVRHPFDAAVAENSPFRIEHAYWDIRRDWTWNFTSGATGQFTEWFWPVSAWFDMLTAAGFAVERFMELRESPEDDRHMNPARARVLPFTMAFKARKR